MTCTLVWWRLTARSREPAPPREPTPVSSAGGSTSGSAPRHAPVFTDVTTQAGIDFVHVCGAEGDYWIPEEMGSGGAFFDYDNDGDMDLYLVQSGHLWSDNSDHRNRLYRNDGDGRFTDVSEGSGADIPGYGMGCAAADYDNDGDVDLYVTRVGGNVLLRNEGGPNGPRFTDVTEAAGVGNGRFGTAAAFFDFDRDGLLDLFVVNYVAWPLEREEPCWGLTGEPDYCNPQMYGPSADRLYHNTGNGRFEDVTDSAGMGSAAGNGLGALCTDFNGDGWCDIYVANDQTQAFLWVNKGDGTFVEDALLSGCAYDGGGRAIAGMGLAAEDLDEDGHYDLVVTNIRQQAHLCLRNRGGLFEDVSYAWGFGGWGVPYTAFGIGIFDQDNDGRLDGFVANGAVNRLAVPLMADSPYAEPNQFLRRDDDGRFYDATEEAGPALAALEMSRGVILGDYDNDGDLDVVVTNNRGPARLLRNESSAGHGWLMVDLTDRFGCRNALNARLELTVGQTVFRREVRPHTSYLVSHDPRVHFGLGGANRVDRLDVRWADGTTESFEDLGINRVLRLRQGDSG